MSMFTKAQWIDIADCAEGQMIDSVWYKAHQTWPHYPDPPISFEERRRNFLWLLHKFLEAGRLHIGKHGVLLEGTPEGLTARFDATMPRTAEEAIPHGYIHSPDPAIRDNPPDLSTKTESEILDLADDGLYIWFFIEECPGGAVWILDDGRLDWT